MNERAHTESLYPSELPSDWLFARVLLTLVLGWAGMGLVMGGLALVLTSLGLFLGAELARDPALMGIAQLLGLAPAIWFAGRLSPRVRRRRAGGLAIFAAFVAGISLQFVLGALSSAIGDLVPFFAITPAEILAIEDTMSLHSLGRAVAVPFSVVFVAPLTEELLFRGALQPALERRYGLAVALTLTAVLFGAFHVHRAALIYASLAGLVLGALAYRSRSILPSFALHAGFNGASIFVPEALLPIPGFNSGPPEARIPLAVLVSASLMAVAALMLFAELTPPRARKPPA